MPDRTIEQAIEAYDKRKKADVYSQVSSVIAGVENASASSLGDTLARLNARLDCVERAITNHRRAGSDRRAETYRRERAFLCDVRRYVLDSIGR